MSKKNAGSLCEMSPAKAPTKLCWYVHVCAEYSCMLYEVAPAAERGQLWDERYHPHQYAKVWTFGWPRAGSILFIMMAFKVLEFYNPPTKL